MSEYEEYMVGMGNLKWKSCKCGSKIYYNPLVSRNIPDLCETCQRIKDMKQTKLNDYTNEQANINDFGSDE